jgi:DNA-binding beta-propeller fold protein YncE
MEDLAFVYDDASAEDVLVQNLKDANQIAVFHYKAYTSTMVSGQLAFHDAKYFPTTPTSGPHGLAMVPESNEVLIAGGNGKLVTFDLTTHKITASCDIAPKVDEIAYDPGLDRVYCASGTGAISVAYVSVGHLAPLGDVPSAPGAHSIAVDPKTHTVWIAYVKNTTPCVQPFTAK